MEETTREREERLKGWSTFLEGGTDPQKNNELQAAQGSTTTTTTVQDTELSSSTKSHQQGESQVEDQEADSTDSSLAGSDEDEAWDTCSQTQKNGRFCTVHCFVIGGD